MSHPRQAGSRACRCCGQGKPPDSGQGRGAEPPLLDCSPAQDRWVLRPAPGAPSVSLWVCLSVFPGSKALRIPHLPCPARPAAGHSGEEWRPSTLRHASSGSQSKRRAGVGLRVTAQQAGDWPPDQDMTPHRRMSTALAGDLMLVGTHSRVAQSCSTSKEIIYLTSAKLLPLETCRSSM